MLRALAGRLTEPLDTVWLARACLRLLAAIVFVAVGYLLTAGVGGIAPFEDRDGGLAPTAAMKELPEGFLPPPQAELEYAGEGDRLPYRLVWRSDLPVAELGSRYHSMLENGWELMYVEETLPAYRVRIARTGEAGEMTHWAMLDIEPLEHGGSRVSLEFIITGGLELR